MPGRVVPALKLAVYRVRVLAATAGPVQAVVTRVACLHAALSGQVTQQTREKRGHEAHAQKARTALRVREGTGLIRAGVPVVVVGTVVEHSLHQTHARSVFHHVFGRTQTLSVAGQPRGQRPGRRAFAALAFATILTDILVSGVDLLHLLLLERYVRRQKEVRGGVKGFGLSPHSSLGSVGVATKVGARS